MTHEIARAVPVPFILIQAWEQRILAMDCQIL